MSERYAATRTVRPGTTGTVRRPYGDAVNTPFQPIDSFPGFDDLARQAVGMQRSLIRAVPLWMKVLWAAAFIVGLIITVLVIASLIGLVF